MLAAVRSALRKTPASRRGFVSTVLLSKTYDDKTAAELRAELRQRGLPTSGNKATLVTRLRQEVTASFSPSQEESSLSRAMSLSASSKGAGTPSNPAPIETPAPGPSQKAADPGHFFDVKLPAPYIPERKWHAQVPYLPDFWDSAMRPTEAANSEEVPKIALAAGAETHPSGGPVYNLEQTAGLSQESEAPSSSSNQSYNPSLKKDDNSFVGDLLEDIGLPRELLTTSQTSSASQSQRSSESSSSESASQEFRPISRPLDDEERKGVYALLGLLASSWLLAGIFTPRRAAENHALKKEEAAGRHMHV